MDNKERSGGLDRFLAGKGFYIVLFLCAAIIGISVWSLSAGGAGKAAGETDTKLSDSGAVSGDYGGDFEAAEPVISSEAPQTPEPENPPAAAKTGTWKQGDAWYGDNAKYAAALDGETIRAYSTDTLSYDATMSDWRTHDGIDVAAADGTAVKAVHAGKVESVGKDDMYGVSVVVDQGGGVKTTYANLRESPAVQAGDTVSAGDVIGYIGSTAICEAAEAPHVHISMSKDGRSMDPATCIP